MTLFKKSQHKEGFVDGRRVRHSDELRSPNVDQNPAFKSGSTLNTFRPIEHEKSERQKQHDLRNWRRKLGFMLLGIIILSSLGIALISQFSGSFVGVSSNATSLDTSSSKSYQSIVNEYFAKNPFERFSFARRTSNLNSYLTDKAPEIESVKITQSSLLVGKLEFTFRQPVAKWVSGSTTSYVDGNGVVFEKNFFEQPKVSIEDNSGAAVEGSAVTSSRFLSFIGQTSKRISKQGGGEVDRVVVPSGALRYAEIYLASRAYPFKVQVDRDPTLQAEDVVAMVKFIDTNKISPSYIDVRVSGKAYWK